MTNSLPDAQLLWSTDRWPSAWFPRSYRLVYATEQEASLTCMQEREIELNCHVHTARSYSQATSPSHVLISHLSLLPFIIYLPTLALFITMLVIVVVWSRLLACSSVSSVVVVVELSQRGALLLSFSSLPSNLRLRRTLSASEWLLVASSSLPRPKSSSPAKSTPCIPPLKQSAPTTSQPTSST